MTRIELTDLKYNFIKVKGNIINVLWEGEVKTTGEPSRNNYAFREYLSYQCVDSRGRCFDVHPRDVRPGVEIKKGDIVEFAGVNGEYIFMNDLTYGNVSVLLPGTKKGRLHFDGRQISSINGKSPYVVSPIITNLIGLIEWSRG